MQISERMTRNVELAAPGQTIGDAARLMADLDVGALPVGENDRLVGMVTDRDIVVRALVTLGDIASSEQNPQQSGEALSGVSRRGGEHSQSEARSARNNTGRPAS